MAAHCSLRFAERFLFHGALLVSAWHIDWMHITRGLTDSTAPLTAAICSDTAFFAHDPAWGREAELLALCSPLVGTLISFRLQSFQSYPVI